MAGIEITRRDLGSKQLRAASAKAPNARVARRMLALAMVLEGADRKTAAETCGMDRQTLRDWVHRYNADGLAGLANRSYAGPPRRLSPTNLAELAVLVEKGPNPEIDGVVRWRQRDLQRVIRERWGVTLHERTVGKQLKLLGFKRLSVRAQHPQSDPEAQEAFKKNFCQTVKDTLPDRAQGKPLEIWFQDEARVGQQGTLTRVWARRGTRPRGPRDRRYKWAYIFGAVCPQRATSAALVLPNANAEMLSLHLAEIAGQVAPGAHAVLLLDGAGYHIAGDLDIPDNITLLKLPRYSPELNPIENVWQYLRQNKLALSVFENQNHIIDACCDAWNFFTRDPAVVWSITTRSWAEVTS